MPDDELFLEAVEPHNRPASPSFFEDFWREAEQRQRRAARRWRVAALALAAVAAAATTAAGVLAARSGAASTVDRTWECTPAVGGFAGHPTLGIHGAPETSRVDPFFQLSTRQPAANSGSGLGVPALHFDTASSAVATDPQLCNQVRAQPVFGSRGLEANNVYTSTFLGGFSGACRTPRAVLIRAHITFAHGRAATAKVIVVSAAKQKPIAYFTWAPHRIAVWLAPLACDVRAYPY